MASPRRSPFLPAVAIIATIAIAAACAAGSPTARATDELKIDAGHYVIPPHIAPMPGTLIAARHASNPDWTSDVASRQQILYTSTGPTGRPVAVSAQVLLPEGKRPSGGWPVIAWAHGTTGLADRCAPSLAPRLGDDDSAVREVGMLLTHGYAVVATDYPGLGTSGVHPYLIGSTNGDAVVDSVVAAHTLLPRELSTRWAIVGHSEGGQTALFAAQIAARRAPKLDYRGVVALAPASLLEALPGLTESDHDSVDQAYLTYAIAGLGTVDPSIRVEDLFTPAARSVVPDLTGTCVDGITNHFAALHLDSILDATPTQLAALSTALARYDDPGRAHIGGPVLLLQGLADTDVPAGATEHLRDQLVGHGDHVSFDEYPHVDHEQVIAASAGRVTAWLAEHFDAR